MPHVRISCWLVRERSLDMTRRRQGALIAAIILAGLLTYIAAAAGHPMYLIDLHDLETP